MATLALGALALGVGYKFVHKPLKRRRAEKVYDYSEVSLMNSMSMLVHHIYFRDLNGVEDFLATFLGYQNGRADNYGKQLWRPRRPRTVSESYDSDLKELGLAFLELKDRRNPPFLAIVLRGTIPTKSEDLVADLTVPIDLLHRLNRVVRTRKLILDMVESFRNDHGPEARICMTGHSLGAAVALLVGKYLYLEHQIHIDTHLFNPPLVTLSNHGVEDLAELSSNTLCEHGAFKLEVGQFERLRGWTPHFYLNPNDLICSQYIKYFKRDICRFISPVGSIIRIFFGVQATFIANVVPSAKVHISHKYQSNRLLAHSLRQWHKFNDDEIRLETLWAQCKS